METESIVLDSRGQAQIVGRRRTAIMGQDSVIVDEDYEWFSTEAGKVKGRVGIRKALLSEGGSDLD